MMAGSFRLATLILLAWSVALPAAAAVTDGADTKQVLTWIAQLLLLLVPTVLGLAFVIRSLRQDLISRRRTPYRQRGPDTSGCADVG